MERLKKIWERIVQGVIITGFTLTMVAVVIFFWWLDHLRFVV